MGLAHARPIIYTYSHLYNTLVAPVMDYSSCIWGFKHHKCLENVQNNAIRFFLWVGKHFPIASLVGDIGWVPAEYRHIYNLIKWWLKISSHDTNRLSKCILTWSMELASKGVRNWCWQVNKSLVCLQLPSMLINQGQYTACSSTLIANGIIYLIDLLGVIQKREGNSGIIGY